MSPVVCDKSGWEVSPVVYDKSGWKCLLWFVTSRGVESVSCGL